VSQFHGCNIAMSWYLVIHNNYKYVLLLMLMMMMVVVVLLLLPLPVPLPLLLLLMLVVWSQVRGVGHQQGGARAAVQPRQGSYGVQQPHEHHRRQGPGRPYGQAAQGKDVGALVAGLVGAPVAVSALLVLLLRMLVLRSF